MCDTFTSSLRTALCVFILMLGLGMTASAQFRAGIQGAVTDPQGAAITGATVTLTNKETNRTQQATSGDEGYYRFDRLAPGQYMITAEQAGFKKQVLESVVVDAEQTQGINIQLETGEVTETVTVSSEVTEQLQTENANIDGSISEQEILRLPQAGRDPYELARTAPGIFGLGARSGSGDSVRLPNSSGPGGSSNSVFQTENQVPISANGQRVSANSFEIDGVSVNSQAWGGAAVVTPNQESVKEVRVASSSYSAENGRNTGALIQVVSQNGTNDFHGSLFFKYNEPALNAFNKWGGPSGGSPRRNEKRFRQYGGSIGGPIYLPRFGEGGPAYWSGKDKLFFFFSYETVRNRTNNVENKWIEAPEFGQLLLNQRSGTLASQIVNTPGMAHRVLSVIPNDCASAHPTLADPLNCRVVAGGLDIGSPTGVRGQSVANQVGGGLDGIPDIRFAQVLFPSNNKSQQFNGRFDFQATNSDLVALSFYYTPNDTTFSPNGRPIQDFLSARRHTAGSLLYTRTISPTTLNEARFNVTRWYFDEFASNPNSPWGIPHVRVADFLPEIDWAPGGAGVFFQTSYNFRDILSKVVGSHGLKFGGEVAHEQNNDTVAWAARPDYFFGNLWNFANDAPVRETGHFDPRTGIPTDLKKYIRGNTYSLFVQDDWKARPNLTLNLGLRWEYFAPLKEKFGNLSNFILGSGQNALTDARFEVGKPLHEPDRNNFGPQLGFAWSPQSIIGRDVENKLVLRGGFGIGYNRIPQAITLNGRLNPPFLGQFTIENREQILYTLGPSLTSPFGYPSNPSTILRFDPATNIPLPTPGVASPNVETTQQDVPNPYSYRYSLEAQYDLPSNWVASLGYQGSGGRKFPRVVNYSLFVPASPRLNSVRLMLTDVNMNFNAMIARLSHRFSNSFDLNAQYRWSKSIDTCSDDQNCVQSYPFDQSTERGPSDYDVTHAFTATGLWDLPILRNRQDFVGKAFGGWQLNGILTTSSGFPWTPVYDIGCVTLTGRGNVCPLRPIAYSGGAEQDMSNEAFQRPGGTLGTGAARFFTPPPGGDAAIPPRPGIGRNVFRGPGYFNIDMSLIKRVGLPGFMGETSGLDLRANFFNIFNNLNLAPFGYNSDSTRVNNVNFGRATEALSGRVVEFQVRLSF
ncbi:MAG: TonB-dependent receptor [Pyrinomonadaceae bacterium]|nr:TonB-dependent receptor [Pyrinomonadaceae bacterium]